MIRNALALLGTANYSIPGRINAFWHEHAEIIEAIERRDPEAAEKAAQHHLQKAAQVRLELMFSENRLRHVQK